MPSRARLWRTQSGPVCPARSMSATFMGWLFCLMEPTAPLRGPGATRWFVVARFIGPKQDRMNAVTTNQPGHDPPSPADVTIADLAAWRPVHAPAAAAPPL